jgi:cytochrome c-type biogenesis protein CcmH/NrfG
MNKRRVLFVMPVLFFCWTAVMPGRVFAQTEKGIELYHSWQYQEAEKVLRDALQADPLDVKANYYLGLSLLLDQKYDEALEIFLRLEDERLTQTAVPDKCQTQIALARARLGLKQYAEAWKNLEAAEKDNAYSPDVYVYRGVYYLQQNKEKKAIKELEKAIGLDEENAYAHYYAGHAYLRSGNPARAVDMFKTFIHLAPQAPEAAKANALIAALC